jgi:hypothetical protein
VWAVGWVDHINVINEPLLLSLKDMERNGCDFSGNIISAFSGGAVENHEIPQNVSRI